MTSELMETPPTVSLIAALARNRVIGVKNSLPWDLPEDLAHFRLLTLGHPILMGRKTFESIGRPLPRRANIVITRQPDYQPAGCRVARSLPEALSLCRGDGEAFVIGGAELYAQALPLANRLYLTEIDADIEGDAWFPAYDQGAFEERSRTQHVGAAADRLSFDFVVYERKKA